MITEEDFEKIKRDYSAGNIQIGINLSEARKLLISAGNKTSAVWFSSFTIMILLSFIIGLLCLGGWGILYGIIFSICTTVYIGNCSIGGKTKQILFAICIVGLISAFFFEFRITIILIFLFFNLLSVCLYYDYIREEILNKIFLKKEILTALLEEQIITIL